MGNIDPYGFISQRPLLLSMGSSPPTDDGERDAEVTLAVCFNCGRQYPVGGDTRRDAVETSPESAGHHAADCPVHETLKERGQTDDRDAHVPIEDVDGLIRKDFVPVPIDCEEHGETNLDWLLINDAEEPKGFVLQCGCRFEEAKNIAGCERVAA